MAGFVAVGAKNLEISRMITTTFRQRQDMMTVAFSQFNWLATVLARAFVTLINPLTQFAPLIYGQSAIPLKAIPQTFYIEVVHALKNLTIPRHATTYRVIAHRTGLRHSTPFRTSTTNEVACHTSINHTPPCQAPHYPNEPRHAVACHARPHRNHKTNGLPCLTTHHLTSPDTSKPNTVLPRLVRPCRAKTTKLFDNLKLRDHEAAKLGAEVANTNSLAGELQNIVDDFRRHLIVNHFDAELQRPAGLEGGAQAHNTRPIHNDGAHVDIQRLVCVGVQLIGNGDAMRDFVRRDDDVSLKQIFVRLPAPASDLKAGSSLDHRAFKVDRGLIDHAVTVGVKILAPFLRVVNRAGLLAPALAHRRQFWHGVAMLHEWGDTLNLNLNRIHLRDSLKQNPAPLPDCELSRLTCRGKGAGLYPQSIKFDKQKTTRESLDAFDYMATFLNGYEVQSWQ